MRAFALIFLVLLIVGIVAFGGYLTTALSQ